jgi:methionyl-tRNA synthetase
MLVPFLPFSSQKLHRMLGYEDVIAPQPEVREFSDEGGSHHVITGDYASDDRWRASILAPGTALPVPEALFKRLDPVLEQEELSASS